MNRSSTICTAIFVFLILYVFSSGPIVSAISYGIRNDPARYSFYCHCFDAFSSFYVPLFWIASEIGLEDVLISYFHVFGYEFPFRN